MNGLLVREIVAAGLGFEPTQMRCAELGIRNSVPLTQKRRDALFRLPSITWLTLETESALDGPSFEVATVTAHNMQALYWKIPTASVPPLDFLHSLALRADFNAGFAADYDDIFWQSEETLATYEIAGRPTDNLLVVDDPVFGGKMADVRSNPGRRSLYPGMWLVAAWRNWFGPGALRHVDSRALLSFEPVALRMQLNSATIFIQLYEDVLAASDPENRERQRKFRIAMGFDALMDMRNTLPR
ncbi:MAG: hypothetical protein ACTHQM_25835 [Thermoanaerobaculia bacterium]